MIHLETSVPIEIPKGKEAMRNALNIGITAVYPYISLRFPTPSAIIYAIVYPQ
jgi:hypothetical protein